MQKQTKQPIVLAGISGGIAAYKACSVIRELHKDNLQLQVAMTSAAQRFVTPLTFEALTGKPVLTEIFPEKTPGRLEDSYPHLYPATQADLFIVLPATANIIGKLAHGLGDDIVSLGALSLPENCRRIICPAMNHEMWGQAIVQENMRSLIHRGWLCIGPESGSMACGSEGPGRMSEPETIVARVREILQSGFPLKNKKLLILSGPTQEPLDPVRYVSNHSSGLMGKALAETAAWWGSDIDFITGPVPEAHLPRGKNIRIQTVSRAAAMLKAARKSFAAADFIIFVAAVTDYAPTQTATQKMPKTKKQITLELQPTPDIAETLCQKKSKQQVAFGFALETHDGKNKAQAKVIRKNLDGIILNGMEAFGAHTGKYDFILPGKKTKPEHWGKMTKTTAAARILEKMLALSASDK